MPTALFDLDGTLVDSVPDILAALQRLAGSLGLAPYGRAEVTAMIGDGVQVLVERALAARGRPFDQVAHDRFLADYTAHAAVETAPFPGMVAALDALRAEGWTLCVCTNKPEATARALLDGLDLARFFAVIGGGDSFPMHKPDPGHLLATLAAAGATPARAVMIGDHRNDVVAARGAGLPCIFAGWGYGQPGMDDGAAAIAATPAVLPGLLRNLRG